MNRLPAIALALACLTALSGATCAQRDGVAVLPPEAPRLDRPDSVSMRECTWPIMVKLTTMTKQQVEDLLRSNATNQIDCYRRHHLLIQYITQRDEGLRADRETKS